MGLRQNSDMDRPAVIQTYGTVWITCVSVWIGYGSACGFRAPLTQIHFAWLDKKTKKVMFSIQFIHLLLNKLQQRTGPRIVMVGWSEPTILIVHQVFANPNPKPEMFGPGLGRLLAKWGYYTYVYIYMYLCINSCKIFIYIFMYSPEISFIWSPKIYITWTSLISSPIRGYLPIALGYLVAHPT